jgi:hypothetical protein
MSASTSVSAWLHRVRPLQALVVMAAIGMAAPAFAGKDTLLDVTVEPLATQVNVSTPTNVGYTIDIANNKTSGTATNVRFTGKLPQGATAVLVVSVDPTIAPPSCPVSGGTLTCSFGKLAAGEFAPTFRIFFEVPAKAGAVKFTTTTFYAEGEGPNAIKNNSSIVLEPVVTVGAVDVDEAATLVPPRAGGNVVFNTDTTDKFSTKVNVPSSADSYALGSIKEVPNTFLCNNFIECFDSELDIKRVDGQAFQPHLSIALTALAENVRPGTQVGSLILLYKADNATDFAPVNPCQVTDTAESAPCINGAPIVTKVPGKGNNFTFNVISPFNGSFRFP